MTTGQWTRVKELFETASVLSPADRRAFLAAECNGDEEVRVEVESLLAAGDGAGDFIETPAVATRAETLAEALREAAAGRRIGPYVVLNEIGQGGMGAVYRAARVDEFQQQVAIKVVKRGMDTDFIVRRFRNERQILANLDHPNIARLLDGGATSDGLPYFVMEYIEDGRPVTEYADQERLSVEQRLQLFRTICSAVAYAHAKLVVHRDIKPGNILVNRAGVPKLLDFGIAKILDLDAAQAQTRQPTQTIVRLMTPEYASPEQIRGQAVTPASDIYSLGVLLYELLSGHRPYRLQSHAPEELVHVICETDPPRPSTVFRTRAAPGRRAVAETTVTAEPLYQARQTEPEKLRRRLNGDLDNIVLMALRKEPERRYASAEAFSEDLRRHIEGLPVAARRDTLLYRASKFVERNRAAVSALAAVLVVLLAAWLWASRQPGRPQSLPRRSVAVIGFRNLSGRPQAAWLSTAFSQMLNTELAAGERLRTVPGENVTRLRGEIGLPEADSFARDTLARIRAGLQADYVVVGSYLSLGDEGKSVRLDVRVQDTVRGETVAAVSDTGSERELLALVSRTGANLRRRLGMAELTAGGSRQLRASQPSNAEAARYYSEGMNRLRLFDTIAARDLLRRAVLADPEHALSHAALALALASLGDDSQARAEAKRAFDLSDTLPREDRLFVEGRYYETIRSWPKALETYRDLFDFFPDNIDYGLRLAESLNSSGKGKDAIALLENLRRLPGADTDPRIDIVEASAAGSQDDHARQQVLAAQAAEKGLAQGSKVLVARSRLIEGRAFQEMGEYKMALSRLEESRKLYAELNHDRGVLMAMNSIGTVLLRQGDLETGRRHYEGALKIGRQIGNKAGISSALDRLGGVLRQMGRYEESKVHYREALEIRRQTGDTTGVVNTLNSLGLTLLEQGRLAEARELYEESLGIARQNDNSRTKVRAMQDLSNVLRSQGDLTGATAVIEELIALLRAEKDQIALASALRGLALIQTEQADIAGARRSVDEAIALNRGQGDMRGAAWGMLLRAGIALDQAGYALARRELEQALPIAVDTGQTGLASRIRLALAETALFEGRPSVAAPAAQQAIAEFRSANSVRQEAAGHVVLALALLAQGNVHEAQAAAGRAIDIVRRTEYADLKLECQTAAARVQAAAGQPAAAIRSLEPALADAVRMGFVRRQYETRLALAEAELMAGRTDVARQRLDRLIREAGARGLGCTARRATLVARRHGFGGQ